MHETTVRKIQISKKNGRRNSGLDCIPVLYNLISGELYTDMKHCLVQVRLPSISVQDLDMGVNKKSSHRGL